MTRNGGLAFRGARAGINECAGARHAFKDIWIDEEAVFVVQAAAARERGDWGGRWAVLGAVLSVLSSSWAAVKRLVFACSCQ